MRIVVSERADDDLLRILSYLGRHNPQAIDNVLRQIDRCFESASSFPFIGVARPELGRDVRRLVAAPYLIFYAVRSDHITILRVLHGSRDIDVEFNG